ncbi:MAG: hypothetical protein JXA77_14650 [Bacteroidales bacterium]|nr:hypothetical protein [Bacteroidales bacterium]MBN2821094.1 hypothetical protein [Bacteroidales bacterium]
MKRKRKIVVFIEFDSIRNIITRALEQKNFEVHVISNLDESDKVLNGTSYNLFIADNDNRLKASFHFINKIRSITSYLYTPILLLTTGTKERYEEEYKPYNIAGYLPKPFDMNHFSTIIERLS